MLQQATDATKTAHFIAYFQARKHETEEDLRYAEARTGPLICRVTDHGEIDVTEPYKQSLRNAIDVWKSG